MPSEVNGGSRGGLLLEWVGAGRNSVKALVDARVTDIDLIK
jgi:hypothetical protein